MKIDSVEYLSLNKHHVYYHDQFTRIICLSKEEIFEVTSDKGTLSIYCPGCGQHLRFGSEVE